MRSNSSRRRELREAAEGEAFHVARRKLRRAISGAPQRYQRHPLQHVGMENAAQASPADRGNQALLFIESERRGGNAGLLREPIHTQVVERVRAPFDPYVHGDDVRFDAACWMVGARAPFSLAATKELADD